MDYLKLDPRMFDRPEFFSVNWFSRQVYLGLLMLSAKYDLHGRFIGAYGQQPWLLRELGLDVDDELDKVIDHLVETSHLSKPEDGSLVISNWEAMFTPKDPTAAARQSKRRAKLLAQSVNAGTVSHGTIPNQTKLNSTSQPLSPLRDVEEAGSEGEELTPEALALLWNTLAYKGAPRVLTVDGRRETTALARLSERPLLPGLSQEEFWTKVITSLNALPFYTGNGPRGWKADFDYIIRLGTAAKILEQSASTAETPRQTSKVEPGEDLYGGEG